MTPPATRLAVAPREVTAAEFDQMVAAHEAFLAGRRGGKRALQRLIVARGMSCERRNLSDAEFTGSDFSGSSFVRSDLERVSLYCANLTGADFTGANLRRADLRAATFAGAKMIDAVLDEADLRAAVLAPADETTALSLGGRGSLAGARLNNADLTAAEGRGVDFTNCSLRGARLRDADLSGANFSNANLSGVDLKGAQLEGVQLSGAILTGVDAAKLGLPPEALADCVLDPSAAAVEDAEALKNSLTDMELWARTNGEEGAIVSLDDKDLRPLTHWFKGRALPGLVARRIMAIDVNFRRAQLAGAHFDGADLRGADFSEADLRGASFRGANLSHARFAGALITPLDLINGAKKPTVFDGAVLTGTGLTDRLQAKAQR